MEKQATEGRRIVNALFQIVDDLLSGYGEYYATEQVVEAMNQDEKDCNYIRNFVIHQWYLADLQKLTKYKFSRNYHFLTFRTFGHFSGNHLHHWKKTLWICWFR